MAALELQQVALPSELPALAAAELRQEEAPGLQVRLHRRASPPFVLFPTGLPTFEQAQGPARPLAEHHIHHNWRRAPVQLQRVQGQVEELEPLQVQAARGHPYPKRWQRCSEEQVAVRQS